MSTERSPERRPDDGRRAELIDAALRVVARDGFAALTTRRIAAEAKVPLGLVHYWFAGKDELVEQVVRKVLDELTSAVTDGDPALTAVAEVAVPSADEVLALFRSVFDVVRNDDPGRQLAMYELTVLALRTPGLRDSARRQYTAYRDTAEAAVTALLDRPDVDLPGSPATIARFVATLFDGVTLAWLADPDGTKPDDIFAFVSELLAGYRPAD